MGCDDRMRVYLIDSENVVDFVQELKNLEKADKVLVFVTVSTPKISYTKIEHILKAKCKVEIIKCMCGYKDDLDKQIISYLGYLIKQHNKKKELEYYIISKDRGYEVVVSFWKERGSNVKLVSSINESLGIVSDKAESEYDKFTSLCKNVGVEHNRVRSAILSCSGLSDLHNKLCKIYGEKGKKVYTVLHNKYCTYVSMCEAVR